MTGEIVALVPTRGLRNGKTRLAGFLSPEARGLLTEQMLRRVVTAALEAGAVATVAVISPDVSALEHVRTIDDRVIALRQDPDEPGLNAAIAAGRTWALARQASALLVLFGDLPLLTPDDVRRLVAVPAPVVLAPDRHETGTNALLLRFDTEQDRTRRFVFQFGAGSAERHAGEARRLGLRIETVSTPGTALDFDTPEDWSAMLDRAEATSGDRTCLNRIASIISSSQGAQLPAEVDRR